MKSKDFLFSFFRLMLILKSLGGEKIIRRESEALAAFGQAAHGFERVYLCERFVITQAQDAREAQGVAALVAARGLHAIKRDLDDDACRARLRPR